MLPAASHTRRQILSRTEVPCARLSARFAEAAASGYEELYVRIGDFPIRVRIAGRHWAEIVQAAVGHLAVESERIAPALCIDVWDAEETGVPIIAPTQFNLAAPGILMRTSEDGQQLGEERPHALSWLNRPENRITGCIESTRLLNIDERARPFHKLLSVWLETNGIQFVHAGLIEHGGKGVLFVGNGGAGKSTTSIACLLSGMGYLGDDFLGLRFEHDRFIGYGLYATCLLNVDHIRRFPDLQPLAHVPNHESEDKCVLYLTQAFARNLKHRAGIDILVLPRVVDSELTSWREASKAAALRAIAPTSVMYLPRPNRAAFERLAILVENTPCFWLELGRRIDSIPKAVEALVAGI